MRLKAWRAQRVMTQKDLADKSGVSFFTIQGLEQGKHLPSIRTARRLAEALQVEPLEIDEVAEAMQRLREGKEEASLLPA